MTAGSAAPSRVRSTLVATGGIVMGSAPGMLLPFAVAAWFGAGRETDTYFLLVAAATTAATVLSIVMERVVVPFAADAQRSGSQTSLDFARRTALQAACLATVAHVVVSNVLLWLVLPLTQVADDERGLAVRLAVVLLPFPGLVAASSVLAGWLYAAHRYAIGTWSLGLRALGALGAGLALRDAVGLEAIAAGLGLGEAVRTVLLAWVVRTAGRALPSGETRAPTQGFWRVALPHVLSMVIVSLNPLVDRSVAASLAPGSTTVLELADKLYYVPSVLLGSGLAMVTGSHWAGLHATGDQAGLAADYRRSTRIVFAAGCGIAAVAALVAWQGARLVHGPLGIPDALPFTATFVLLVAGLPFALSAEFAVRLLTVLRRTWVLTAAAAVLLVVNLIGDLIGASLLGLPGIALSSTLVRAANLLVLGLAVSRLLSVTAAGPAPDVGRTAVPAR